MTRRWNSIHSSPDGSFRSFPDQLDIQEHSQRMKRDGALVIKRFADQFPIQPDAPYVVIEDSEYCWLSYNWIHPLARWIGSRRCLEIMCGSGALSYALRTCGVQAIATDNFSWKKNFGGWYERPWTEIKQMDCLEAIRVYGPQTDLVVCSWPYMDDTCYHALLEMRKVNPAAQMLYIGEPAGGATASKAFFDAVTPVADEGFQAAVEGFRSAYMLKDMPMLFH